MAFLLAFCVFAERLTQWASPIDWNERSQSTLLRCGGLVGRMPAKIVGSVFDRAVGRACFTVRAQTICNCGSRSSSSERALKEDSMNSLQTAPQIFPEDLLTGDSLANDGRRWWVVHTKARQEKAIARDMRAQSMPYFSPQTERITLVRGRKRRSLVPVFSGYMFLFGSEMERYRSLMTNRAARVIKVDNQIQLRQDLARVWRMIESKVPLTVEGRLATGDRVRVRTGVLAGIEGIVTERRAKCRLLVAVHLLHQGVSVEIEDFMLEPI